MQLLLKIWYQSQHCGLRDCARPLLKSDWENAAGTLQSLWASGMLSCKSCVPEQARAKKAEERRAKKEAEAAKKEAKSTAKAAKAKKSQAAAE